MRTLPTVFLVLLLAASLQGCGEPVVSDLQDDEAFEAAPPATGPVLRVDEFGAVGDGVTDDGPAILAAIDAAIAGASGASLTPADVTTIRFENKRYRIEVAPHRWHYFMVEGARGLTLEGNGATLIFSDRNLAFSFKDCRNMTVRGFRIDHDPVPYTQGTIGNVHRGPLPWFELTLEPGFPRPRTFEAGGFNDKKPPSIVLLERDAYRRKSGTAHTHVVPVTVTTAHTGGAFRVTLGDRLVETDRFANDIDRIETGDRFVMALGFSDPAVSDPKVRDIRVVGDRPNANIIVALSDVVLFENIRMFSSPDKVARLHDNLGRITFRNFIVRPRSGHLASAVRDGIHTKNNRVGPTIENSHFEGILDDLVNLNSMSWTATSEAKDEFVLATTAVGDYVQAPNHHPIRPEDMLLFVDVTHGEVVLRSRVASVTDAGSSATKLMKRVVMVDGLVEPLRAHAVLRVFNLSASGDGFEIRNSVFRPLLNRSVVATGAGGTIEGNTFDCRGGTGIWLSNFPDTGAGPWGRETKVLRNKIRNAQLSAIRGGVIWKGVAAPDQVAVNLTIEDNDILLGDGHGIHITNARNVDIVRNFIHIDPESKPPLTRFPVRIANGSAFSIRGLVVRDKRPKLAAAIVISGASPPATFTFQNLQLILADGTDGWIFQ